MVRRVFGVLSASPLGFVLGSGGRISRAEVGPSGTETDLERERNGNGNGKKSVPVPSVPVPVPDPFPSLGRVPLVQTTV